MGFRIVGVPPSAPSSYQIDGGTVIQPQIAATLEHQSHYAIAGSLLLAISIAAALNGPGSPAPATLSWVDNVGLEWADYIEPGDESVDESGPGNRAWFIDADAASGGDGTYATPYNGNDINTVNSSLTGGDHIYLKGTFTPLNSNQINLSGVSKFGTAANPTLIRSWLGNTRAIIDTQHARIAVDCRAISVGESGLEIRNIHLKDAISIALVVYDCTFADVHSVEITGTRSSGGAANKGGYVFKQSLNQVHDQTFRNGILKDNGRDPAGDIITSGGGNNGASNLLSEGSAANGSIHRVYLNDISQDVYGLRNKHSGNVILEYYNNIVHDCRGMVYLRAYTRQHLHHNIFDEGANTYGGGHALLADYENVQGDTFHDWHHNTIYNCGGLFTAGTPQNLVSFGFSPSADIRDNIVYDTGQGRVILLAEFTSNGPYDISNWTHRNNWYFTDDTATNFLTHETVNYNFANAMTHLSDVGSSQSVDPMFENAAAGDFRLQRNSPALKAGTNLQQIGALALTPADVRTEYAALTAYIVDIDNGNDASDGLTEGSAWLTISKAMSTLTAGDIALFRAGTYSTDSQQANPTNQGTSDSAPLVFGNYPGETAIWDRNVSGLMMEADNKDYIYLDGIILDGGDLNSTMTHWANGSVGCRHRHCVFRNLLLDTDNGLPGGSVSAGSKSCLYNSSETIDCFVEYCLFDDITVTNTNPNLNILGLYNPVGMTYQYNKVTNSTIDPIFCKAPPENKGRTKKMVIRRNHVDGSNVSAGYKFGDDVVGDLETTIHVLENLIETGVLCSVEFDTAEDQGFTQDVQVSNNTTRSSLWGPNNIGVGVGVAPNLRVVNLRTFNNITYNTPKVWSQTVSDNPAQTFPTSAFPWSGNAGDYMQSTFPNFNCFVELGNDFFVDLNYPNRTIDYAEWQGFGFDANSIKTAIDPFEDAANGDYRLKVGSEPVGAGRDDGFVTGNPVDMGCFAFDPNWLDDAGPHPM